VKLMQEAKEKKVRCLAVFRTTRRRRKGLAISSRHGDEKEASYNNRVTDTVISMKTIVDGGRSTSWCEGLATRGSEQRSGGVGSTSMEGRAIKSKLVKNGMR